MNRHVRWNPSQFPLNPLSQCRKCPLAPALGLALLLSFAPQSHAARTELDLRGTWQFQKVTQITYPPTNSWQTMSVPGFLSGWQYEHAWFRRLFTIPSSMAGTQLKLRFGAVKYNAQVWLNGTFIGSYLNGYEPFELDITGAGLVGQTNELLVAVTDWTALFSAPVDFSTLGSNENPRDHVKNTLLAPIGGRYELYGLWQQVKVVSVPAVSISDVFVMPSVRTQQLTVRITLRNDSPSSQTVNLTNRVLEDVAQVLLLPGAQVTLPSGTTAQVGIAAAWTNAHLWTHLDPHLYSLETTLVGAPGLDMVRTRFGFREFWTDGGRFYLNGTPINLLATSTWPPNDLLDTNQIRSVLLDVKAGNNVAMRLHTQPWDEKWYDVADEIGLLLVEECAVWCDPWSYRLSDAAFWTNYSQHLSAAVKRDRNHPSIVLWSLENEILHCGGEQAYTATDVQLAAMGRVVKGLDPTRPITYEADLDPGGEASALGLHYPHEYPDFQVWPNAAWWMDQPIARDWVPGGQWVWDRTKPLYVGEFLWVPNTSAADFTILFGDDAYSDSGYYRNQAKGLTWRMQIEAFRSYGVNGICPWTLFEDPTVVWGQFELHPDQNYLYQAQKAAYEPNLVFSEEYNSHFFVGESAQRTVRAFNDRMNSNNFTLRWKAGTGSWQTRSFSLPPAGQRRDTVSFQVPSTGGSFPLQFELSDSTNVVFTNTINCSAYSRPTLTLPPAVKAGLYDPRGTFGSLAGRFGLQFAAVTNLHSAPYDQLNLLLIAPDALTNESLPEIGPSSIAAKWDNFALHGGWVLVLEQTNYPAWMPLGLQEFDASFAFPNSNHPVTSDLTAADLRWWADDNRLVAKSLVSPSRGNFRVLASVGSRSGLEYAAAAELPNGPGGILCSQWLLTKRFDLEPLAGLLLQREFDYCVSASGHLATRPAALITETNSSAGARLAGLGLQAENILDHLTNCDSALYPVMIVAGGNAVWQSATLQLSNLTHYVDAGGRLLLHRPSSAFLVAARPVLFPEIDSADVNLGLVLRHETSNAVVRLSNHDLYWIDQPGTWNQSEVLSTNVASRYYRRRFDLTNFATIQVENMPIHTSGGASAGGWLLWANGYVAQDITVTQPGSYLFNVLASGTPALGGWPQMSLKIDGRSQDTVTVPTNQLAFYTLSADLSAGTHQLAISFDNDAYAPPEDRNLFLDEIRWGRDFDTSPATLLTRPGAVAQVRRGNGVIILDEVQWETETQNLIKANRYISSLLTGLGAAMKRSAAVNIEAENMTNVNVAAYSSSGGIAYLNSNGRIETKVQFTTTGTYTFDLVAGGTAAVGVMPQIAVVVDGVNRTNFFLSTTAMTHYSVTLTITAGTHAIGLAFLNDYYAPPEDRNAAFDSLTIAATPAFRIVSLEADPAGQLATLQWETTPGKAYEVQIATNLASASWCAVVTNLSNGSIESWLDTGELSGSPPLSAAAPRRFYRIRQAGP